MTKDNKGLIIAAVIVLLILFANANIQTQDQSIFSNIWNFLSGKKTVQTSPPVRQPVVNLQPVVQAPTQTPPQQPISSDNNYCADKYAALKYAYDDLFRQVSVSKAYSYSYTTALDSQYKGERKICGTKYWDRVGCDSELWIGCTNSMFPLFSCYNSIVTYTTNNLQIGDVVAYRVPKVISGVNEFGEAYNYVYSIHRIVDLNGSRYVMRGDNNYIIDKYQPTSDDVIGKVKEVMY